MNLRELLETVHRIDLKTNRLVNDTMVGAYLSHFKGRGMDFEELREYMPGDDVRDIDWNVTHRMRRPFIKRFREERELGMILVIDVSASSAFGSSHRSKREFATEVAATLAFSAARNSDKIGLLLFSDQIELFVPPRKGRRHILRIIREMLSFEPKRKGTDIPAALIFLNHVLHRRAIVFLLTDFLHSIDLSEDSENASHVLREIGVTNARHDLVCVHLHDPRESEIPNAGLLTLEDSETGELLELDTTNDRARQTYADINRQRLARLDQVLTQSAVDTLRLRTDEPFALAVQRFFELRRGRRRG
jgi:uncharacterized protein (DUF58 family)